MSVIMKSPSIWNFFSPQTQVMESITNRLVCDILKANNCNLKDCLTTLRDKHNFNVPQEREETTKKKLSEVRLKAILMKKGNKMRRLEEFLDKTFVIPSSRVFSNATLTHQMMRKAETQTARLNVTKCALENATQVIREIQRDNTDVVKRKEDELTHLTVT